MPLVATAQIASSGHNAASDSRSSSKSVASSSAITALTDFPRSDFRPALTATSFADRVDCSIARRSLVYAYMPDWGLNPTNPSMGGLERSPAIVTLHHRARRQEPARDIPLLPAWSTADWYSSPADSNLSPAEQIGRNPIHTCGNFSQTAHCQ